MQTTFAKAVHSGRKTPLPSGFILDPDYCMWGSVADSQLLDPAMVTFLPPNDTASLWYLLHSESYAPLTHTHTPHHVLLFLIVGLERPVAARKVATMRAAITNPCRRSGNRSRIFCGATRALLEACHVAWTRATRRCRFGPHRQHRRLYRSCASMRACRRGCVPR